MFSASSPPRRPRTRLLVSVVAANAASAFSSSAGTFRSFRTPPNRANPPAIFFARSRMPRSASCGIFTPPAALSPARMDPTHRIAATTTPSRSSRSILASASGIEISGASVARSASARRLARRRSARRRFASDRAAASAFSGGRIFWKMNRHIARMLAASVFPFASASAASLSRCDQSRTFQSKSASNLSGGVHRDAYVSPSPSSYRTRAESAAPRWYLRSRNASATYHSRWR